MTRQLSGEDADKSEDEKQDSIKPGKSDSSLRPFLRQPLIGVVLTDGVKRAGVNGIKVIRFLPKSGV